MKDHNHDLVQALHHVNDQNWRIDQHYTKNATLCPSCLNLWQKLREDGTRHEQMLREEITRHINENRFD
jgi:hypothetical protein